MMKRPKTPSPSERSRRSQAGVTLVELLVAMLILGIVTTMLITGWISLQRASAFAVQSNDARASARDALDRISSELRDSQPQTLATLTATPTPAPTYPLFTTAKPMEAVFYSAYNQLGANADGSGTGALMPTRIYLDVSSGSTPQKTLYWQRKTDASTGWTSGYRQMVLATNVVNNSIPSTGSPTAVFTYGYRTGGHLLWTDNSDDALDLNTIVAVRIRVIVDVNLAHTPSYVDLSTTVIPRNAGTD